MARSTEDESRKIRVASICARHFEVHRAKELFLTAVPATRHDSERKQFVSMAERGREVLAAHGLSPSGIVWGHIYLAKTPAWDWREELARSFGTSGPLPITALVQPPAAPYQYCTLQLHAIQAARPSGVWHGNGAEPVAATVLRHGARHLRLMSITPRRGLPASASFEDLTYDMFAQAGHALVARGLSFRDVVRTWIYVQDIDRNYAALNRVRQRYFAEQKLARLPASTGVSGVLPGAPVPVTMDLYAVGASNEVRVEATGTGLMGEASDYGSAFARGSRVVEPGRTMLYVSGTASINEAGDVVAPGDIAGQLERMFINVRALLGGQGMSMKHALCATTYLKHAKFRRAYLKAAAVAGLPADLPQAVVVADICRPEWLCELELCAVQVTSTE
jgi:enamine deaminase RidA (YjgF/YER057c/UK114 family)